VTGTSLAALLASRADLLEGLTATQAGRGTDYRLDDALVASVAGDVAEFRLRDDVASVALRTPDVTASSRGAGWVRFAPRRLDGHGRDRALAWFESAWRRADTELSSLAEPPGIDADGDLDGDVPLDESEGEGAET
jgi:hypothetical protein